MFVVLLLMIMIWICGLVDLFGVVGVGVWCFVCMYVVISCLWKCLVFLIVLSVIVFFGVFCMLKKWVVLLIVIMSVLYFSLCVGNSFVLLLLLIGDSVMCFVVWLSLVSLFCWNLKLC